MAYLNLWGEEEEVPEPEPPKAALSWQELAALKRERATQRAIERKEAGNPLIAQYGSGPDGALCGGCGHFMRVHHHGKNYMKCNLRKLTHGAGSDHRTRWQACGKFEAGENQAYNLDMMRRD